MRSSWVCFHEVMLRVERSVAKEWHKIRQKSEGKFETEHQQYSDSRIKFFAHVKNPLMRKQIYLIRTANNTSSITSWHKGRLRTLTASHKQWTACVTAASPWSGKMRKWFCNIYIESLLNCSRWQSFAVYKTALEQVWFFSRDPQNCLA